MRRSRLRSLWLWSWAVTVPIAIAWSLWAISTYRQWRQFAIDYDAGSHAPTLHDVGRDRWNHMVRAALLPFRSKLSSIEPEYQLANIQLFVKGRDQALLDHDLPYSGFAWQSAGLVQADGTKQVKIRYRGDALAHWGHDKKSMRIKTSAADPLAGMREWNLIAPKSEAQVNDYLSYRLGAALGLITPRAELVSVWKNGRYHGLHQFTEQLCEGTLLRHGRMPGDLYAGDLVGRDAIRGASNFVFESPAEWRKVATDGERPPDNRAPLAALLAVVSAPMNDVGQARLSTLLDMTAFGRFGAFELLTQSHQYDEHQNWRLFWDPWRGTFEPVIWDAMGWSRDVREALSGTDLAEDMAACRLQMWLLSNGDFLAARDRALVSFFGDGTADRFDREVDWALRAARAAIARDPDIRPTDPERIEAAMQRFAAFYRHTFANVRRRYLGVPGGSDGTRETHPHARWSRTTEGAVRVELSGREPIRGLTIHFKDLPAPVETPTEVPVELRFLRGGTTHRIDLTAAATRHGDTLHLPVLMFAQLAPVLQRNRHAARRHTRQPLPTTYDLDFGPALRDIEVLEVLEVRAQHHAGGTNEAAPGTTIPAASELPVHELAFLFRPTPPLPRMASRILRGTVQFAGVTEFHEDVVIAAGTTVHLEAGASLLFGGRVTALGTAEQPIRFVSSAPDELPWGTIALTSTGCSGSRLRWCEFRGGSGWMTELAEYPSMFAIHNCDDVTVEHCRFEEPHQFDDVIHVVYAECTFDDVAVIGALSDALDCDISKVTVRNSTFRNSGNDDIDLSATDAVIHDCLFQGSGDRGVSADLGSRLLVVRGSFRGCEQGLEVKDGSVAVVANSDIRGGKRAVSATRGDRRYPAGGHLTIAKSSVLDNAVGPIADRWSRVLLTDCQFRGDVPTEYDQHEVDGTVLRVKNAALVEDHDAGPEPRSIAPLPFPVELQPVENMADEVWRTVRADRRGLPDAN